MTTPVKKKRYSKVIEYLQQTMPVAESKLNYTTPYELLVAVILSAKKKEKRILFRSRLHFLRVKPQN